MDMRLDGSFGTAGRGGDLGVGHAVDVTQDDGDSLGRAQAGEQTRPGLPLVAPGQRVGRGLGARVEGKLGRRNPADPGPVAGGVEQDRRQPAADAELADPGRRPEGEGTVGANERVLDELLGIEPVAPCSEGDREEPVLVGEDKRLEGSVEIGGQRPGEGGVIGAAVIHHAQ